MQVPFRYSKESKYSRKNLIGVNCSQCTKFYEATNGLANQLC